MGFFDDYNAALESYPADYVTLEIVNIAPINGTASLNAGERASFDVRVKNAGPLQMADLEVRIKGLNGALVKNVGAADPFDDEVIAVNAFPVIAAHNTVNAGENGGSFEFLAPATPQPPLDLVEVSIENWTALTEHLHQNHAQAAPSVKAVHRDRVRGN
jgi:hypothetical protein